jgi:hypothetical protein
VSSTAFVGLFAGFAVFFAVVWMAASFVIAKISGWAALAERYRLQQGTFTGWRLHFQSGRMRLTARYGGALTIGANEMGLYLAVNPLFRVGHPPLFIPWHAIDVREGKRFSFREVPGVQLDVSQRTGNRVLEAAGGTRRASPLLVP